MFKNLTLFIFGYKETTLQRNATKYERQVDSFCRRITVWSESLKIFAFASCVSGPVSLTELSRFLFTN